MLCAVPEPQTLTQVFRIIDHFFTVIFALELTLNMVCLLHHHTLKLNTKP